jgi:3-deoxy-7-phosphoheptulonate synthase
MSFNLKRKLPAPSELIAELPLAAHLAHIKKSRDDSIRSCFVGEFSKFLVIVGPCSAHNEKAVCDYVCRLARVQEKISEKVLLIPRIYTNKPRTTGAGYKGMLHQPNPVEKPDIVEGIRAIRKLHLRVIAESGLTGADEMLYPENHLFLDDLLSYVAIGARSTENQQHRLTASGIGMPAGFKNPTSGDIRVMMNSIYAAQQSHVFSYAGSEAATDGNSLAHAVLRGYVDKSGNSLPNYHFEDLRETIRLYETIDVENRVVIIDTNHANSGRDFAEQPRIAREILESRTYSPRIRECVRGLMIESFIAEGQQSVDGNEYGKSITDPCLGWDDTERLLMEIAEKV